MLYSVWIQTEGAQTSGDLLYKVTFLRCTTLIDKKPIIPYGNKPVYSSFNFISSVEDSFIQSLHVQDATSMYAQDATYMYVQDAPYQEIANYDFKVRFLPVPLFLCSYRVIKKVIHRGLMMKTLVLTENVKANVITIDWK